MDERHIERVAARIVERATEVTNDKVTRLDSDVSGLTEAVRGNGRAGLIRETELLKQSFAFMGSDIERIRLRLDRLLWFALSSIVTAAGGLVVALINLATK